MPFKRHPSQALVFSVLNRTASKADSELVTAHIATCARCRAISERYDSLLQNLRGVKAPQEARAKKESQSPAVARRPYALAFKAAGCIAAAAAIAVFFMWPKHIETVSAAEILSRAEAAQQETTPSNRFYQLRVGHTTCDTADSGWAQKVATTPCAQVHSRLAQAQWNEHDMLSAHSYRRWHDGLIRHRDSVLHQESYWTIKTDTDEGVLRSASLRVRASDYRPVELTLEFTSLDPVSVVEAEVPYRDLSLATRENANQLAQAAPSPHFDDPTNKVEAEAWKMLREIGADSGWEVIIIRDGSRIKVAGVVSDASRQALITKTFSTLPNVAIDLNQPAALPRRNSSGSSLPQAETLLETAMPDVHERSEQITQISNASQAVLGKAFVYDRLRDQQRAMGNDSAADALNPLLKDERADLVAAMGRLENLLEQFPEIQGRRSLQEPLSYTQARSLDTAILALFNASSRGSASLQENTNLVRSLLPRRKAE